MLNQNEILKASLKGAKNMPKVILKEMLNFLLPIIYW